MENMYPVVSILGKLEVAKMRQDVPLYCEDSIKVKIWSKFDAFYEFFLSDDGFFCRFLMPC